MLWKWYKTFYGGIHLFQAEADVVCHICLRGPNISAYCKIFSVFNFRPSEQSNGFRFSDKVTPICLPPHTYRYSPRSNTDLIITGWGKIEGGGKNRTKKSVGEQGAEEASEADDFGGSDILREASVPLISPSRCRNNKVTSRKDIKGDFEFKTWYFPPRFILGGE